MMFGVVVGMVAFPLKPVDMEVVLGDPILDPIESHVHGFGPFDFGPSVGKPIRGGIICGYSSRACLVPAHFPEDVSNVGGLLTVMEEGPDFGLSGGGHDVAHHSTFDVDGAIGCGDVRGLIRGTKVEVPSYCGPGLGLT